MREWILRPEGAKTNQPRATPWDRGTVGFPRPERAPQVPLARLCVAPSGLAALRVRFPRALPWADMWLPLRGEDKMLALGAGLRPR